MAAINKVILMGRLTADPELRKTASDISAASFSLAVDRRYVKGEEKKTDFINCVAWRSNAEFLCKYFTKGSSVLLEGSIQVRNYVDKNDNKRQAVEVLVDKLEFGEYTKKDSEQANTAGNGSDFEEVDAPEKDDDLPF